MNFRKKLRESKLVFKIGKEQTKLAPKSEILDTQEQQQQKNKNTQAVQKHDHHSPPNQKTDRQASTVSNTTSPTSKPSEVGTAGDNENPQQTCQKSSQENSTPKSSLSKLPKKVNHPNEIPTSTYIKPNVIFDRHYQRLAEKQPPFPSHLIDTRINQGHQPDSKQPDKQQVLPSNKQQPCTTDTKQNIDLDKTEQGPQFKPTPQTEKSTMKVPPSPRYSLGFLNELQNKHKFSTAVCKQNEVATTAIQSLDCLNDQIVQYIVSSQCPATNDGDVKVSSEAVHSSMVLIRRLLLDAQSRFRKMVEDNKQLANHIDTSIQAANQEVNMLRAELASTNKRLSQMSQEDMGRVDAGTQVENDLVGDRQRREKSDSDKEDTEVTVQTLAKENEQLMDDYRHLIEEHDVLKCAQEDLKKENENLKSENTKLQGQLKTLRQEFDEIKQVKAEGATGDTKRSYGELKLELIQTRQELNRAKEVLQSMKSDRKRLKGEKLDLLSQMKQLYTTLEEKETELRDFIRNYEQRVRESDDMIKQLAREKEDLETEKWEIITKAKDATERAMFLKAQLDTKEQNMKEMEAQLSEAKEKLSNQDSNISSTTISEDADNKREEENESFGTVNEQGFSTMEESSVLNCVYSLEENSDPQIRSTSPISNTDSADNNSLMFKWFTQSTDFEIPLETKPSKKKKKSFGSLSRVFSRGRLRRSIALPHAESLISDDSSNKLCVLSQDNYQEKLNIIEKMVGVHMKDWRAHQVLAWLEITLAMPMYAQNCLSNVKSGRVLLGLSDNELSAALGVTNPMHRRKLRLAIEQHRNPDEIKYLKASEMDPTWIAHRFLPDLGLPQYTDIFEEQLCDGHVLNTLTRRDLEKHFSVHRKFHQSSILHAIELLRRIDFNKEKLYHRRNLSEDKDIDLIVWTNERLIKWTKSIDLGEYSEHLVESGVHGALMVLEPSFNADSLSAILGIPPSKSYIRRHLASELETILKLARAVLDTSDQKNTGASNKSGFVNRRKGSQDKGLGGSDDKGRRKSAEEGRSRLSFRGSLGRAFGKKVRDDLKMTFDSQPSKKKISAPIPIQHLSLSSLDSDSELVKKGFCLKNSSQRELKTSQASLADSKIKSVMEQDLQQRCWAKSDNFLHRNLDLDSRTQNGNGMQKLQGIKLGDKMLRNSVAAVDAEAIMKEGSKKSSQASSLETLTEQSIACERNNNRSVDVVTLQNKIIVHQSFPDSPIIQKCNDVGASTPRKKSPALHDKQIITSKPPLKPPNTDHTGNSTLLAISQGTTTKDTKPSNRSSLSKDGISMKKKRGSLKDLFPQTTSV